MYPAKAGGIETSKLTKELIARIEGMLKERRMDNIIRKESLEEERSEEGLLCRFSVRARQLFIYQRHLTKSGDECSSRRKEP